MTTAKRPHNETYRRRAEKLVRMIDIAEEREINPFILAQLMGIPRDTAQKYMLMAREAGALVAVDDFGWRRYMASKDHSKVDAFLAVHAVYLEEQPVERRTARAERRHVQRQDGRHIHLRDGTEHVRIPDIKPVARDPFDALFFGAPKVAA